MHRALPVGSWARRFGVQAGCAFCGLSEETQRHVLWDCALAKQVWQRVLRLFSYWPSRILLMWGSTVWGNLSGISVFYESHPPFEVMSVYHGIVSSHFMSLDWDGQLAVFQDERWVMISAITLWNLWKSRCEKIFGNVLVSPVTIVQEIWSDVIHMLMAQYEALSRQSEKTLEKRQRFLNTWCVIPCFRQTVEGLKWSFVPPRFLFPSPIT